MLLHTPPLIKPRPTMTRLARGVDPASRTIYTFSNVDIGQARADKVLVLISSIQTNSPALGAPTVTVDGAAPLESHVVETAVNNLKAHLGFWKVPNDTSVDIVITNGTGASQAQYQGWVFTGLTKNDGFVGWSDFSGNGTSPRSGSVNLAAGGFAVGVISRGGTVATTSWSVLTEFFDEAADAISWSGGEYTTNTGVVTTLNESVSWTGGGNAEALVGTVR